MVAVAPSYSAQQVLLCTIDVLENPDMTEYSLGGYPTVRVFSQNKATKSSFLGAKDETFVREFIDSVIANPTGE